MKKQLAVLSLGICLLMTGCPKNATTLQKCATASDQAAVIVQGFQTAEITAHQQGLIPDVDHTFIQKELQTLGHIGITTDSCIRNATNNGTALGCTNAAIAQVNQIYLDGGLYLKSPKAKSDFQLALTGVKGVLTALSVVLGGPVN